MKNKFAIWLVGVLLLAWFPGTTVGESCPSVSKISEMTSSLPGFKEAGPYDLKKIKSVRAFAIDGGKRIKLCLSNMDLKSYLSLDALAAQAPKKKGDFALIVQFNNGKDPVVAGKYSPKAGYGKPFWVTAEILTSAGKAGTFVSIGAQDGTAEIFEIKGNKMCGKFALSGPVGKASGVFNAEVVQ